MKKRILFVLLFVLCFWYGIRHDSYLADAGLVISFAAILFFFGRFEDERNGDEKKVTAPSISTYDFNNNDWVEVVLQILQIPLAVFLGAAGFYIAVVIILQRMGNPALALLIIIGTEIVPFILGVRSRRLIKMPRIDFSVNQAEHYHYH
jgi:hypothetical protein